MNWFVIQAYSNCEKKVKLALEERIDLSGLKKSFGEIMIPTEQVTELKKGQKKTTRKKVFSRIHAYSNGNE
jgi:transcriptional antiterminator NusG